MARKNVPKPSFAIRKITRTSSGVMRLKISKSSSVIWLAKSLTGILVTSNNAGSKDFSSSKSTPLINSSFFVKISKIFEFFVYTRISPKNCVLKCYSEIYNAKFLNEILWYFLSKSPVQNPKNLMKKTFFMKKNLKWTNSCNFHYSSLMPFDWDSVAVDTNSDLTDSENNPSSLKYLSFQKKVYDFLFCFFCE